MDKKYWIEEIIEDMIKEDLTIKKAASKWEISQSTLYKYIKSIKDTNNYLYERLQRNLEFIKAQESIKKDLS